MFKWCYPSLLSKLPTVLFQISFSLYTICLVLLDVHTSNWICIGIESLSAKEHILILSIASTTIASLLPVWKRSLIWYDIAYLSLVLWLSQPRRNSSIWVRSLLLLLWLDLALIWEYSRIDVIAAAWYDFSLRCDILNLIVVFLLKLIIIDNECLHYLEMH